jgi:hypothetical protein
MRNLLYKLASILGWINSIQRGTVVKRLIRVIALRNIGGIIGRIK